MAVHKWTSLSPVPGQLNKDTRIIPGVIEYLAWFTSSKIPIWNRLVKGRFQEIKEDEPGMIKSTALPGLWIPVQALKERDWWTVMAATSRGVTRRGRRDFMATIWRDSGAPGTPLSVGRSSGATGD